MVLHTESKMEGIPYASDFIARTHWTFSGEGDRIVLRVWHWLTWLKNPFVKST